MKLHLAVTDDNCLLACDEKISRLLLGVRLCYPNERVAIWTVTILDDMLAKALMLQGTTSQKFTDGYEAVRNFLAAGQNGQAAILEWESL